MGNTTASSNPKSQFDTKDAPGEEDIIDDEGDLGAKNLCSLEISQKIKQDPIFPNLPRAESHINPLAQPIFERLHNEELKKLSPHCGSPMSRRQFLERQELQECVFKPQLGEVSEILAEKHKNRLAQKRIEDALLDDATKRRHYRVEIERAVLLSIFY